MLFTPANWTEQSRYDDLKMILTENFKIDRALSFHVCQIYQVLEIAPEVVLQPDVDVSVQELRLRNNKRSSHYCHESYILKNLIFPEFTPWVHDNVSVIV